MSAADAGTTRRTALSRALLLAGGAFGALLAGRASAGGDAPPFPIDSLDFVLHVPDLFVDAPDRTSGRVARPGDRFSTRGGLYSASENGEFLGDLFGSGTAFDERIGVRDNEQHTFVLDGGTLLGIGTSGEGGSYAIVGGTGKYSDARGGYTVTRNGRGAAFNFQLQR